MIRQPEQYYMPRAIVDSNQSYPTKNQTWEDVARHKQGIQTSFIAQSRNPRMPVGDILVNGQPFGW